MNQIPLLRAMVILNTAEWFKIERGKINCLRFADDLVLLVYAEFCLQHALNGVAAACDIAGIIWLHELFINLTSD